MINPNVDLETEDIARKRTNQAFQRYVCRSEKLSSFRIQIGNISPSATQWHFPLWKWGTKNPKTCPSPWTTLIPSNTAMPRPTASTTRNRSSDGWGTVACRRRKSPLFTMACSKCAPKSTPSRGPIAGQTPLSASYLDPSDLWCQTASGSDPPFFHSALDRPTDQTTDRQIVHGSLTTISRCVPRATRPNNNNSNTRNNKLMIPFRDNCILQRLIRTCYETCLSWWFNSINIWVWVNSFERGWLEFEF